MTSTWTILFGTVGLVIGVVVNRLANILPPRRVMVLWRSPFILALSGLLYALLPSFFSLDFSIILAGLYTLVFLLVLVIDFEHRLILDDVILPATLVALLASVLSPVGFVRSVLGGLVGYAVVYGIYKFAGVFSRWRGYGERVPFGLGDVKLAGFMGLVFGVPGVFPALLVAVLLGGLGALAFLVYEGVVYRRLALGAVIPYGPFFCIAGWVMMVVQGT